MDCSHSETHVLCVADFCAAKKTTKPRDEAAESSRTRIDIRASDFPASVGFSFHLTHDRSSVRHIAQSYCWAIVKLSHFLDQICTLMRHRPHTKCLLQHAMGKVGFFHHIPTVRQLSLCCFLTMALGSSWRVAETCESLTLKKMCLICGRVTWNREVDLNKPQYAVHTGSCTLLFLGETLQWNPR